MLEQGLTYIGNNPFRQTSPLAGLPAVMVSEREVVWDTTKRADLAPADVKAIGETPDSVTGRESATQRYGWPVFRETLSTRGVTGGFTEADGVQMMRRIGRGCEQMIAQAFETGKISWKNGATVDIWDETGASPVYTTLTPWDDPDGDPLTDILGASDLMVSNGAHTAHRLLLSSSAFVALMKNASIRETLDNRRVDAGQITLAKSPSVVPVITPSDAAHDSIPGLPMQGRETYDTSLHSFAYVGDLAGIEIYRDCVGVLTAKQAVLLSRGGVSGGEIDADYHLGVGYPWVGGEQIKQPGAEFALYKSITPDGAQLDSFSFLSLRWSNPYGAISMRNLAT